MGEVAQFQCFEYSEAFIKLDLNKIDLLEIHS